MPTRAERKEMTGDDFTTGLLAGLVLCLPEGHATINQPPTVIEEAFIAAFEKIEELAKQKGIELRFWIAPLWTGGHAGSLEAHRYLLGAFQTSLLKSDMPGWTLRIQIDRDWAPRYIEDLALGEDEFKQAATAFLEELTPARARYNRAYWRS